MRITIGDDLDLQKIADSGQCFRVREWEGGWFRFITEREVLYLQQRGPGVFEAACTPEAWEGVWRRYFDLDRSYAGIRSAVPASDPYLYKAADAGAGIRILRQAPWETLVTFIISQRKSIPAIRQCVELLAAHFGDSVVTPWERIDTFPDAQRLAAADEQALAACKLGYRAPFVRAAAGAVASGALDLSALERLPDAALLETLKGLYGVGDKIANCVGLFAYGRTGMAPVDTWIRKVIDREYHGQNPFPAYGDAAGVMQQYAFYSEQRRKAGG